MTYEPVAPTRLRLRQLLDGGASIAAIAATVGVAPATLVNITQSHNRWVQDWTAQAIAKVTIPETIPHETTGYPAIGAHRRITALLAIGWTHTLLTDHAGLRTVDVLHGAARRVDAHTYQAIRDTYDRLSMTPGPSAANRGRAERHGWAPPLAWDEHSIDDPNARPYGVQHDTSTRRRPSDADPVNVQRAVDGQPLTTPLTRAERIEVVRVLARRGLPDARVAQHVGTSTRAVLRDRAEHGIPSRVETGTGQVIAA